MFKPKYTITDKLLANIKTISSLVFELNSRRFPETILMEFEKEARAVSSFASTSIEGNPLPLTEVKRILKSRPDNLRQSEQEVLNYNLALKDLNSKLSKGLFTLNLSLILDIQRQVMDKLVPKFHLGKLRVDPVFVNNPKTGETVYWPPDAKDVENLMMALIDFTKVSLDKIDPLIAAGIFHKQFVIIHPFMDGNGRTARLATKILLAKLGLNTFNLFSFENYYNRNVAVYFNQVGVLGNYYERANSIDFTVWLEYFTDGIIDELLRVKKLLPKVLFSPETKFWDHHKKILNFINKHGFITDREYARLTTRAKATRILDFKHLLKLGLIERLGKGKNTYYKLK